MEIPDSLRRFSWCPLSLWNAVISIASVAAGVAVLGAVQFGSWGALQPVARFQTGLAGRMSMGLRLAIVTVTITAALSLWESWTARGGLANSLRVLSVVVLIVPSVLAFVPVEATVLFIEPLVLCVGAALVAERRGLGRFVTAACALAFVPACALWAYLLLSGVIESVASHFSTTLGILVASAAFLGFAKAALEIETSLHRRRKS